MKFIAIGLDGGDPPKRNLITNHFVAKGWGYWHWIDDLWLVQVPVDYSPKSLYLELEKLPGLDVATLLLFEVEGPIKYWGRAQKAAWDWLDKVGRAE